MGNDHTVLCAEIFLKAKDRETYNEAFEQLFQLIDKDKQDFKLKKIITDF